MAGSMLASIRLVEKKEKENEKKGLNAFKMGHMTITNFFCYSYL